MKKRTPFPHQLRGTTFLVNGGVLLADDQGLGKTFQMLRAFIEFNPAGIGVVTCPSAVQGVWEAESEMEGLVPFLLTSTTLKKLDAAFGTYDIIVVSIDLVARNPKVHAAIKAMEPSVLMVDECHYVKELSAKRTQAILAGPNALAKGCERVWLTSGTPAPNHVGELYPMIISTEPTRIGEMSRDAFEMAYCSWKIVQRPGRNGQKIRQKVISGTNMMTVNTLRGDLSNINPATGEPWWIRRKKETVLKDLPPKLKRVVPMVVKDLKPITELLDSEEGQALLNAIQTGDFEFEDSEDHHVSRLRRLIALTKVDATADYVQNLIDAGEDKLLVWGWHTKALHALSEALRVPSVVMDGSVSKANRDAFVKRFQTGPGPLVGILQIKAMGTGITLTAANRAVFMEAAFTPGDNAQAEDRIHRIGQDRGVLIDYLCIRGSIDEAVMAVIERKTTEWERLEKSALETK